MSPSLLSCLNFDKDFLSSISLRRLPFPAALALLTPTRSVHERPSLRVCTAAIANLETGFVAKLRDSWRKIPAFISAPHCCSWRQRHLLSGTTRRSWRAADFLAYQLTHMDKGFGSQALPGQAETCVGWAEVKFQLKVLLRHMSSALYFATSKKEEKSFVFQCHSWCSQWQLKTHD